MKLQSKDLIRFLGGYLQISNCCDRYIYYGKIKVFRNLPYDNVIRIGFEWLARGNDFPQKKIEWINTKPLDYVSILDNFVFGGMHLREIQKGRLVLFSTVMEQRLIFFLPNDRILDLSKIEGFQLK